MYIGMVFLEAVVWQFIVKIAFRIKRKQRNLQFFLHRFQICDIIDAESLTLQALGGPPVRILCACTIDGFAKMPLQASIFVSWYNIFEIITNAAKWIL